MTSPSNRPAPDGRNWEWRNWVSADGLTLAARDYAAIGGTIAERPAVLCLPGLTRNGRDYAALAERLAAQGWRVVAPDFRGRGKSDYAKDPLTYLPATYAADTVAMLDALGIGRFVAIGTSLGGLVIMALAAMMGDRIAGVVLNDVGPELDPAGLGRIRNYVGKAQTMPTWLHAARALAETQAAVYPRYGLEDWLAMAKRLYRLNSSGRIVLDYDMKIAEPFKVPGDEAPADLWALFGGLDRTPLLVVRGALSDVLPEPVARRMTQRVGARLVTVAGVGHAPTLGEPGAVRAIDRLLAEVEEPTPG